MSHNFAVYRQKIELIDSTYTERVPLLVRWQFDHENQGLLRKWWRGVGRLSISSSHRHGNVKTPVTRPASWRIRPANNLFAIPFGGQACLFQSPIVARREREWCNRYSVGDKNRYTAVRECKDSAVSRAKSGKSDFKTDPEKASFRGGISSFAD